MPSNACSTVLVFAALSALGACSKESPSQSTTTTSSTTTAASGTTNTTGATVNTPSGVGGAPTTSTAQAQASDCPMTMSGASVQTRDVANGTDLTFTIKTKDDLAELRTRVRAMAEQMNAQHAGGTAPSGAHVGVMSGMPPAHAEVEDIADGARIRITPLEASRLAQVRQHVQRDVRSMSRRHDCEMEPEATPSGAGR